MTTRRGFLAQSAGVAGLLSLRMAGVKASEATATADRPLDILVLGGTGFIGPKQVQQALDRGHKVTIFNRGNRSGLFGDQVEELIGNRDSKIDNGLEPLTGDRTWDVVIDNSGYVPRHVRDSVELLKDRCSRYLYISTIAVYDWSNLQVMQETSPLVELEDKSVEQVTGETYGPLKAECDRIVRDLLGDRATVVRPGFIVGPGDTTDRFTYWVERVYRGGTMLAPPYPDQTISWVDARDLAAFIIDLLERDVSGAYNASGPETQFTRAGMLWGMAAATASGVEFVWPEASLIEELGFATPMMWGGGPDSPNTLFDTRVAREAGLRFRPLAETVADTHDWWQSLPEERRAAARGWSSEELERQAIERVRGSG